MVVSLAAIPPPTPRLAATGIAGPPEKTRQSTNPTKSIQTSAVVVAAKKTGSIRGPGAATCAGPPRTGTVSTPSVVAQKTEPAATIGPPMMVPFADARIAGGAQGRATEATSYAPCPAWFTPMNALP